MVQRIERAFAALGARFADAGAQLGCASTRLAVGGGWATFLGTGSPLTHVVGTDGHLTREHLDQLEGFFFTRGADSVIEVADLLQLGYWLTGLGYQLTGSEQVLAASLTGQYAAQPEVVDCSDRPEEWASAMQRGFGIEPTPAGQLLGQILAAETPLGIVRNGAIVASAAYALVEGVGYCFADSTLEGFRGEGMQQALIRHRMWLASQAGCDTCVSETVPGSGSERNYVRCGFLPVFQRQTFIKRLMVGDAAVRET